MNQHHPIDIFLFEGLLWPAMSEDEARALARSAATLKKAVSEYVKSD